MCMCVCVLTQLSLTPCNSKDCSPQGSMSTKFSGQEYWSRLLFPSKGDLPNLDIKLTSPSLAGKFFTTEPEGKPNISHNVS